MPSWPLGSGVAVYSFDVVRGHASGALIPIVAPSQTRATDRTVGFIATLDLLARHGRLDLDLHVTGDLHTGAHHTAKDTGIVLDQALNRALGDRSGIARCGKASACGATAGGWSSRRGESPPGAHRIG